jgi:hypothetical protein
MIDIFRNDAFSVTSLTEKILKSPYKPGRIQAMGLFDEKSVATTAVSIEEKDGRLSLIQTSPRGGPASQLGANKRRMRSLLVPHLERDSTIYADEVQGVRAFGSENETETVEAIVDERLAELRAMHEVTLEYHRFGAINGLVLDADGSTLFNLYTEFGVSQQTYAMSIATSAIEVRRQLVQVQRLIEDEMGAVPVSGYRAFAGDDFFDRLIGAPSITATLQYQESKTLREDLRQGFMFAGVIWENYRGSVNGTDFIDPDEAVIFPTGSNIFKTYFAPADYIETVNTLGKRLYSKIFHDPELNRFVKVHSQSNPLSINLRPRAVVKLTLST